MDNTCNNIMELGKNIDMAVHDGRYGHEDVHYGTLAKLGDFFGREMPLHYHEGAFQLHYLKRGQVRVYLDERVWRTESPAFFLTPPGTLHGFAYHPDSDGHVLTARQSLILPLLETEFGRSVEPKLKSPLLIGPQSETPAAVNPIAAMLDLLACEYGRDSIGRELALAALTRLIFLEVLRLAPEPPTSVPVQREGVRIFQAFGELVDAQFRNQWRIPQYVAALAVTESRLNDICKRMTGHSPKKIISERLMREARQRLLYSNAQINEIAYGLGFKDPAYFCRLFTLATGLAPSQFRGTRRSLDRQ